MDEDGYTSRRTRKPIIPSNHRNPAEQPDVPDRADACVTVQNELVNTKAFRNGTLEAGG